MKPFHWHSRGKDAEGSSREKKKKLILDLQCNLTSRSNALIRLIKYTPGPYAADVSFSVVAVILSPP